MRIADPCGPLVGNQRVRERNLGERGVSVARGRGGQRGYTAPCCQTMLGVEVGMVSDAPGGEGRNSVRVLPHWSV